MKAARESKQDELWAEVLPRAAQGGSREAALPAHPESWLG